MDNFERMILNKIKSKEELTTEELQELIWGSSVVDEINGYVSRHTQEMTTIVRLGDKLFAIEWDKGITDFQMNEFYNQPYEVVAIEKTVIKYVPKKTYEF